MAGPWENDEIDDLRLLAAIVDGREWMPPVRRPQVTVTPDPAYL